jgi:uncharacterized protein YjbI with pentapeptide repeats
MAIRPEIDAVLQGVEAWHRWRGRNPAIRAPDLSGANLNWANLEGTSFTGANLSEAKFSGADHSGAKLTKTNLSGAKLFSLRPDLRNANLFETTNLTQKQIEQATGNEQTKLPEHLKPPASWSQSSHK